MFIMLNKSQAKFWCQLFSLYIASCLLHKQKIKGSWKWDL